MSARGGMCARPFGQRMVDGVYVSNTRLDKIEVFQQILNGSTPHEFAMFAEFMLKAVHNYWYWALGNNGCTDVKWLDAYDYFFVIRSDKPETWGSREFVSVEENEAGRRIEHIEQLSEDEMRIRCFDVHYKMLNLESVLPMSSFLRMMQQERERILNDNRDQVEAYLDQQRSEEFKRMPIGSRMKLHFRSYDFIKTLTSPASIDEVEGMVMFPLPDVRPTAPAKRTSCRSRHTVRAVPAKAMAGGKLFEQAIASDSADGLGYFGRHVLPLQAA